MADQPSKPKGILRNRDEPKNISLSSSGIAPSGTEGDSAIFDRHAVLLNTIANSQIHEAGEAIVNNHQAEIAEESAKKGISASKILPDPSGGNLPDHLKWDEANLYLTEQEKNATMKITEPKTPYQGAVGESEYYKDDDEENTPLDDLDEGGGLLLGEPELSAQTDATIENDRITKDESIAEKEEQELEEPEETPEERHKRFEEMRKKHYFMKGAVLHHPKKDDDDDDEEGEEDEALKQAKANTVVNNPKK